MAVRERLDRRTALSRRYTAMQSFTYNGRKYAKGDPFPIDGLSWHNVQTLHGARHIDLVPVGQEPPAEGEDRGVTLTPKGGGNYEITAAWLADPVKVRGKDAAEAEAERIRTEGPPLGFIAGGSDVAVEDVGGGWYAVSAPWLEMPEKVHGRDLAETRQREIHETGEPDSYHGVTLTDAGDGTFDIKADWEPESEKVEGEEAARARAAELRAAGPPKKDGEPGEIKPLSPWESAVVVAIDGDKFTLSAPNLDQPETFDTAEAAEARQKELRDAGPPEGWEPPEAAEKTGEVKPGSVVLVEGGDLDGLRATVESIDGDQANVVGFEGEGEATELRKGTVPLASLKIAPDQPAAPE